MQVLLRLVFLAGDAHAAFDSPLCPHKHAHARPGLVPALRANRRGRHPDCESPHTRLPIPHVHECMRTCPCTSIHSRPAGSQVVGAAPCGVRQRGRRCTPPANKAHRAFSVGSCMGYTCSSTCVHALLLPHKRMRLHHRTDGVGDMPAQVYTHACCPRACLHTGLRAGLAACTRKRRPRGCYPHVDTHDRRGCYPHVDTHDRCRPCGSFYSKRT